MSTWIPVCRYRGQLVRSSCPAPGCGFLIAAKVPEVAWDDEWPGALLCCVRCNTTFREGLGWAWA
jgi:hypothetical protein